jgi:hypothetical protein
MHTIWTTKETSMFLSVFTLFHVLLSLVGIGSGAGMVYGLLESKCLDGWTKIFLTTTVTTSVTGFLFPAHHIKPGHVIGLLSLMALALAILARYRHGLAGRWRSTYVITSAIALYFNVFVLVVQVFEKVPALRALAPTYSEPPFEATQLVVLTFFVIVTSYAVVKFHDAPIRTAHAQAGR